MFLELVAQMDGQRIVVDGEVLVDDDDEGGAEA